MSSETQPLPTAIHNIPTGVIDPGSVPNEILAWNGTAWVPTTDPVFDPTNVDSSTFEIKDDQDQSKGAKFDLSNIISGTTVTVNIPDCNSLIPMIDDLNNTICVNGANEPIGSYNTVYGIGACTGIYGNFNVGVGYNALTIGGTSITAIGYKAMEQGDSDETVTIGAESMQYALGTTRNTAIGYRALRNCSSGYNVAVGSESLLNLGGGGANVAVGDKSLYTASSCVYNVAIGNEALYSLETGNYAIAIGYKAMYNMTTDFNIAIGSYAAYNHIGGAAIISIGYKSLYSSTTSTRIVSIGYESLYNLVDSTDVIGIGYNVGHAITHGSNLVIVGNSACDTLTTGSNIIAIGNSVGHGLTTDSNNIIIGHSAGPVGASQCITVGNNAMAALTGGGDKYNIAFGTNVLQDGTSFEKSIGIGHNALNSFNGTNTIGIGYYALTTLASGADNIAIGNNVGTTLNTGSNNIIIGSGATSDGVSRSGCIILGSNANGAGKPVKTTADNQLLIQLGSGNTDSALMTDLVVSVGDAGTQTEYITVSIYDVNTAAMIVRNIPLYT